MCLSHETIICIFAGIERAHAIQFVEKQRVDEVVDGEGIIGVPFDDLLKVGDRLVVLEAVKGVEGFVIERVGRPKRQARIFRGRAFDLKGRSYGCGGQEQAGGENGCQSGTGEGGEKRASGEASH